MKKLIAAALSAAICAGAVSAVNVCAVTPDIGGISAEDIRVAESGKCGANAVWNYENGKLTITGSGDMSDWDGGNRTPWSQFKEQITTVEIGEGITTVGTFAFASYTKITSVKFPSTLKELEMCCFQYCIGLVSVDLPSGLTTIGTYSFKDCDNLQRVVVRSTNCRFIGGKDTISNDTAIRDNKYTGVIVGYPGSTAQAYASKSGYRFEDINNSTPLTTTKATTTTTTSTTTTTTTSTTTTSTTTTTTTTTTPNVSFGISKKVIKVGEYADVYTDGYTVRSVESSAPSVATATEKMIKGVAPGTATITFYTTEGYKTQLTVTIVGETNNLGDVDNNGAINAVDASFVLTEYASTSTNHAPSFTAEQAAAADVDKDGAINAVDASYILSYYAYTSTGTEAKKSFEDFMKQS